MSNNSDSDGCGSCLFVIFILIIIGLIIKVVIFLISILPYILLTIAIGIVLLVIGFIIVSLLPSSNKTKNNSSKLKDEKNNDFTSRGLGNVEDAEIIPDKSNKDNNDQNMIEYKKSETINISKQEEIKVNKNEDIEEKKNTKDIVLAEQPMDIYSINKTSDKKESSNDTVPDKTSEVKGSSSETDFDDTSKNNKNLSDEEIDINKKTSKENILIQPNEKEEEIEENELNNSIYEVNFNELIYFPEEYIGKVIEIKDYPFTKTDDYTKFYNTLFSNNSFHDLIIFGAGLIVNNLKNNKVKNVYALLLERKRAQNIKYAIILLSVNISGKTKKVGRAYAKNLIACEFLTIEEAKLLSEITLKDI